MDEIPGNVDDQIRAAMSDIMPRVRAAFAAVGYRPIAGSALDQNGLIDADQHVECFLIAGEFGLALEHVIYVVEELRLPISAGARACIDWAGRAMGMDPSRWKYLGAS